MTNRLESKYWLYHLWFVLVYPAFGVVLVAAILTGSDTVLGAGVIVLVGVSFVAGWGSLVGYYVEAQRLRDSGSDWVPTWHAYAVLHILFTPVVVAPVYLLDRWRGIGIPWRELKTVRRVVGG